MFSFSACFWSNYVYIGKKKYAANEILTAYLNTNHLSSAEIFLDDLKDLKTRLILTDDMSYDNLKNYNKNVYLAIAIFQKIDSWMRNLPPYKHLLSRNAFGFDDLLNHHSFFFDDGQNEFDEPITWDTVSEFGCGEQNEFGNWQIRIHKFSPIGYEENELTDENMREALRETNRDISNYFNQHIEFLKSYITIHQVFKPFIKDYLHHKETSINANEMAQIYDNFNKNNGNAFQKIECRLKSFGYKSLQDSNGKSILCEEITFDDLNSFIYYDFFNGMKRNYIPNACKNCGNFFLIRSGKYFNYCERKLKDEPDKTCRDVGSKRRYDDKCKNDPIWQTYNRAYKAHYARYMKKKMTISEFEKWSRFASNLRDKAIAGEVEFEQHYTDIRK